MMMMVVVVLMVMLRIVLIAVMMMMVMLIILIMVLMIMMIIINWKILAGAGIIAAHGSLCSSLAERMFSPYGKPILQSRDC